MTRKQRLRLKIMRAINPATGELVAEYRELSAGEVEAKLEAAARAFRDWRSRPFGERADLMRAAAEGLEARKDEFARLMAVEMGKPIAAGRAEVEKCAWVCRYYADEAEGMLADRPMPTERTKSYLHHEPLGVVLAVMPWNFPFWQVFRFAAPGLMAGNTGVLKHASNVPGSALAIEEVLTEAGFPEGVFTTLLIPSSQVNAVIDHPAVAAVTLTGSDPAGRSVATKAGSVLKKTVLELGGSDPYLILADADLPAAAATCAASRLINGGQSCIAAKRFIMVEDIADEFTELFVAEMAKVEMGDPLEESTKLGPQARHDLRDEVAEQVRRSVESGARLLLGGETPEGPGAYYPPTVLAGVEKGMAAYHEEIFGPAAALITVASEDEAVEVANDTQFGLGAAVFSRDVERAERLAAERIEAGCCFVNAFVASDPRLPFGGVKTSGYGRELSDLGIREFVNQKTVVVA
ncbi:MAG TPA: NAD-dependent succinate-semialdehyde dehydrogenase [Acidimicrobiia bacterium]|nr:NAD-dependent succinate-semialdehyde dehydrogenase [Acidimicrobiia bacterium]